MAIPIIAALARGAAKMAGAAAKAQKAAKGAQTASRAAAKEFTSRDVATAKKRFIRAAERYTGEAESVGQRTRYGQMLKKAANRLGHLADELRNVDYLKQDSRTRDIIDQSDKYLVSRTRTAAKRGDLLGETLLNGTMQGHRLFSMTRDIWEGVGYENRYAALKEAFGGKPLSDIILEIEEKTGVNIMKGDINAEERYGTLTRAERMKVEQYIIENYG